MSSVALERRQARVFAMQSLCQWEVQPDEPRALLQSFLQEQECSATTTSFAFLLVESYWSAERRVDELISGAAEHWDLTRMSPVERNVMRVAVTELLEVHTPAAVAINEAIEIGREYGGAESPRFINGILDRIRKSVAP